MFQMRKEREAVTNLGPKARNLWLLGGRVQVPESWDPWVVSLAGSGGGSACAQCICVCVCVCMCVCVYVSQACEKVHCQTSKQILVRPGRCGMHMWQCCCCCC